MTDYWQRRGGSGGPDFEIELTGPDGRTTMASGQGQEPPPPNWRKVAGLSALAGVALGIVASVVIVVAGDDADPESSTTTTPLPTVAPVFTTQSPPSTITDAPGETFPPLALRLPTYPVIPGSEGLPLPAYDLDRATAANAARGAARRSTFSIVGSSAAGVGVVLQDGGRGHTMSVTAASEPVTGLDALTIEFGGTTARTVYDRTTDTIYSSSSVDFGRWRTVTPEAFLEGTGGDTVAALLDAFLTGPITPDTISAARVSADEELVVLGLGEVARRYDVEVPVEQLRPFGALGIANVSNRTITAGFAPASIAFQVYVTGRPELALVTAQFEVAGQVYQLSQRFEHDPADLRIDLPSVGDSE